MSESEGASVTLEMGYSVAEFERVLPLAMRDWPVSGELPRWQISDTNGSMLAVIELNPQPERMIGMLRIPVLMVTIRFDSLSAQVRNEFMQRFERGFHRGGG